MWRKLLESTEGHRVEQSPKVVIFDAPKSLKVSGVAPQFTGVAYTHGDIDIYWLHHELGSVVEADLTVVCIDWLARDWKLQEFIDLSGKKILHVYNYDSQSFDPDSEYIQQYLRLVCLEAKAALAFNVEDWKSFLAAELGTAPKPTPDVVTRIIIPSGWDSTAKILATREDFPVNKDWREIKLPDPKEIKIPHLQEKITPIEMSHVLAAFKGEKQEKQDLGKVFSYLMDKSKEA